MRKQPVLVVNADDFGLTPGVCDGVLLAHQKGIVTSTSALVAAPAFDRYVAALRDSGIGVGLHLCVVGEDPPLLSAREVPTLVDREGRLAPSWRQFVRRALSSGIDPADLRRELTAQAEKLRAARLRVDHVDAHQNLHLWPTVSSLAAELAHQLGARVVRVPRTRSVGPTGAGVRALSRRLRHAVSAAGLAVPQQAAGLDRAGQMTWPQLGEQIARFAGGGHADLAVHPGTADDPDRARYEWGYRWSDELHALCSPEAAAAVQAAGFRLGDFRDLAEAGPWRG